MQQQAPLFVALGTLNGAASIIIWKNTTSQVLQNTSAQIRAGSRRVCGYDMSPGATTTRRRQHRHGSRNDAGPAGDGDIGSATAPQLSIGGKLLSATAQHGSLYLKEAPSTSDAVIPAAILFPGHLFPGLPVERR